MFADFFIEADYDAVTGKLKLTKGSYATVVLPLIKQGDMNQQDETQADYIDNRPHIVTVANIAARDALVKENQLYAVVEDIAELHICDGVTWFMVNDVGTVFTPEHYALIPAHVPGATYYAGDIVTSGGTKYRALTTTITDPPSADWQGITTGDLFADLV